MHRATHGALTILLVYAAAECPMFAQWFAVSDPGVITVTRSVSLPPDDAEFLIGVTTEIDVPQQAVLDALTEIVISLSNLTASRAQAGRLRVVTSDSDTPLSIFQFNLRAPLDRSAEIRKKLDEWRQNPPAQLIEVRYRWRQNPSRGALAEARARVLPEMVVEAQRKAGEFAGVTGRTSLGPLEYASDPAPISQGWAAAGIPFFDPLDGADFQGEGTQVRFSFGFKFGKE